jgi:hypothetical protein
MVANIDVARKTDVDVVVMQWNRRDDPPRPVQTRVRADEDLDRAGANEQID